MTCRPPIEKLSRARLRFNIHVMARFLTRNLLQLQSQPGHARSFRALGLPRFFLLPFSLHHPSLPPLPVSHSLIHSLPHSHPFISSPSSLPPALAPSFTCSLIHCLPHSIHWPTSSLTHSPILSLIHSLTHYSLVRSQSRVGFAECDLKTLLPGQRYRADTEAGLARARRRRHAVPG